MGNKCQLRFGQGLNNPQGRGKIACQVTYKGNPLYLFSNEGLDPATLTAAGNGNGIGGFSLLSP
jgi:hypothetical protein